MKAIRPFTLPARLVMPLLLQAWLTPSVVAQETWTRLNDSQFDSFSATSTWFTSGTKGYILGYATNGTGQGRVLGTSNGGSSWAVQANTSASNQPTSIHCPTANTCYTVGGIIAGSGSTNDGLVLKTTNGGSWFNPVGTGTTLKKLAAVFFVNADAGFATGFSGTGYKTTNGGLNWTAMPFSIASNTPYNTVLRSIHCPNQNTCYTVGDSGASGGSSVKPLVFKTSNGGSTWERLNIGTTPGLRSVHCTSNEICYVAGDTGIVRKTTNGGTTWSASGTGIFNNTSLASVYFTSANVGYMVGNIGGQPAMFKTLNGGSSWYSTLLMNTVSYPTMTSMSFPNADTGYVAGEDTHTGGAAKVFKGTMSPSGAILSQAYFETFDMTHDGVLRYALAHPVIVNIKILDSRGKSILHLLDQRQDAGNHVLRLNTKALVPGSYVLDFRAGNERRAIPITLP